MKWTKLNEELKKKLANYRYDFTEAWKIVGCGEKTLRRYMDAQLLQPIKTSDVWYFTEQMIEKAKFIYQAKKEADVPVRVSAALYDYLIDCKKTCSFDKIKQYIENYNF